MKHISILVLHDSVLSSLDAPRQLFSKVNDFLVEQGKEPAFQIQLLGVSREIFINNAYTIHADAILENVEETDLIIIPMICGDLNDAIEANKGFIQWTIRQYKRNAEIASLCVGSFFLASTGLLNGRACSIHWGAANDFRKMFPDVEIVSDKIITYQHGIYTSGGAYSYLNLILYLIEKYVSREMSIFISKMFEIDIERKSQTPFIIFKGQKDHEDEEIKRAQEFIENNFREKITIAQLTSMFASSRRNFERRFKKATSNTVIEYSRRVRIEAVKKGLESGKKTVTDLMYEVGYSDSKAFRTVFKKVTGLSPIEYKRKFREA